MKVWGICLSYVDINRAYTYLFKVLGFCLGFDDLN
jgi:hypothetical protein